MNPHGGEAARPLDGSRKPAAPPARSNAGRRAALLGVWIASALYLAAFARDDWIPGDDGALGHSAERVLAGELPHRDFDAIYPGVLSYLHALAFRLLGTDLFSLRIVLLGFALAFVPALYALASRVAPPAVAAGVTLLCVAWSVPNHFTATASWYNLFFTAFGTLALVRHLETSRRSWLFAAGLCAGVSVLFKPSGLGFAGAALLFALYLEQEHSRVSGRPGAGLPYQLIVVTALVAVAAALIALVARRWTAMNALHFSLPGIAVLAIPLARELGLRGMSAAGRFRHAGSLGAPLAAGMLLPVGLFALPFALDGSLGALYTGVFVLPQKRLDHIALELPPLVSLAAAAPLGLLLLAGFARSARRPGAAWTALVAAALCVALAVGDSAPVYGATWASVRPSIPLAAVAAFALLATRRREALPHAQCATLLLLVASAALSSVVQLPYPAGVYFCYVAPLAVLSVLWIAQLSPASCKPLLACLGLYYLGFALLWNVPGATFQLGFRYQPLDGAGTLDAERGGSLRVGDRHAREYRRLVREVQRLTQPDDYIYAAPDVPQLYFLTGRKNPTRTLYDLFDADYGSPARVARLLTRLDEMHVDVVVLRPANVPSRLSPRLARAIAARYPTQQQVGPYRLYSRTRPGGAASPPDRRGGPE